MAVDGSGCGTVAGSFCVAGWTDTGHLAGGAGEYFGADDGLGAGGVAVFRAGEFAGGGASGTGACGPGAGSGVCGGSGPVVDACGWSSPGGAGGVVAGGGDGVACRGAADSFRGRVTVVVAGEAGGCAAGAALHRDEGLVGERPNIRTDEWICSGEQSGGDGVAGNVCRAGSSGSVSCGVAGGGAGIVCVTGGESGSGAAFCGAIHARRDSEARATGGRKRAGGICVQCSADGRFCRGGTVLFRTGVRGRVRGSLWAVAGAAGGADGKFSSGAGGVFTEHDGARAGDGPGNGRSGSGECGAGISADSMVGDLRSGGGYSDGDGGVEWNIVVAGKGEN